MWLIFLMQLNMASAVYFSMSNIEAKIPLQPNGMQQVYMPTIQAHDGVDVKYWMQNFNKLQKDLITIDENSGNIHISSTGPFNTTLRIVADDKSSRTASTYMKIYVEDRSECNEELLKSICFWSEATYQVKENRTNVNLGPLSPIYDFSGCKIENISYTVETDKLKLYPPSTRIKYWTIGTTGPLNRTLHGKEFNFVVSCLLTTSISEVSSYRKPFKLKIIDLNDKFLLPKRKNISVKYHNTKIKQGLMIVKDLTFIGDDILDINDYRYFISNSNISDFLQPLCQTINKTKPKILCVIKSTKSKTFNSGDKMNFLLDLEDRNSHNTVFINITLEFTHSLAKRSPNFFRNNSKIFRTAAPFARVTQPYDHEDDITLYRVKTLNIKDTPFNITREGIVYVTNTHVLRKSPEFLRLNITWTKRNVTKHETVVVRVVDEPTKTCENIDENDWTFCSHFSTQKSCQSNSSCALGTGGATNVEYSDGNSGGSRAGPQRCLWRGDRNPDNHETHLYSTCSADTKYCPDGICDSLEELIEKELCPQDCSVDTVFPTQVNEITKRGIDKCNGILICDSYCICKITISKITEKRNKPKENKLIAESKCGPKCIIGASGGLLLFCCIMTGFVVMCKKSQSKKLEEKYMNSIQEAETPFSDYIDRNAEPMLLNFNISTPINANHTIYHNIKHKEVDTKWEFPRQHIIIDQILGEGEFGKVLKAKAFNIGGRAGYSLVAVKTLKNDARKQDYHDLFSEYQLLKEVSHPHVIELLGICSSSDGPLFVIIEYAEFGSLRNYLRKSRHLLTSAEVAAIEDTTNNKVSAKDILSFGRQIASGMSYLSDIKLVHRDLAARNILLAKNKICKISDFGLTRDIYEDNAYFKKSKGRVPVKWMAPESLADHIYTTKSDVWSFGILIWELVTLGASPYPGLPLHNLYNLLKQGYRMERPPNCSIVLYSLMNRCWNIDPEKRPTFLELYHCFDNLLTDNVSYLDLSDNAIINKCYFASLNDTDKTSPSSEDVNLLENYLEKEKDSQIAEKCNMKDNSKELNICLGYETPVKISRPVTPTNQNPEEYTDMTVKQ
ncbi:protein kinase receptor Ret oncogene isoform X2 [Rhynchophorus ferrugineus]|uniref:protein kinase receptor Ret oncogene isoform X2 n=1 Tax=Rhynchophorus ferrugineus TaxID=354439 RepID=UPI003FCD3CCA